MPFLRPVPGMRAPALAFVAMGMVWGAFAALVPVLKAQIGVSDAVFGFVFVIASLGAIASVWLAPLADRALGALSVPVSSGLMALSFLAAAVSPGPVTFVAVMVLVSALSGISDIVMNARISEVEADLNRPLMSLNHGIFSVAYAVTAMATGLAREAGLGPLSVFSAVALIIICMTFFMRAPHLEHVADHHDRAPVHFPRGVVWIGGLIVLVAFFTEVAVEGWSALYIERDLGGGAADGAIGPAILGVTMAVGRLFGHLLSRAFADTVLITAACVVSALGAILAAQASVPLTAQVGFGILGLGISLVVPLAMGLVGRSVPPHERVSALARASAIAYAAFLFGPAVMGSVAEATSLASSYLLVAGVLVLVVAVLMPVLARRLRTVGPEL